MERCAGFATSVRTWPSATGSSRPPATSGSTTCSTGPARSSGGRRSPGEGRAPHARRQRRCRRTAARADLPPNPRRLERELVWRSTAGAAVVAVDEGSTRSTTRRRAMQRRPDRTRSARAAVSEPSRRRRETSIDSSREAGPWRCSGERGRQVTLVNGPSVAIGQRTGEVREGDTGVVTPTTAAELVAVPGGGGSSTRLDCDRHAVVERSRHRAGVRRLVRPDGPMPVRNCSTRASRAVPCKPPSRPERFAPIGSKA